MSQDDLEISVVIPCLNEAETLEACINKAKTCFKEHHLNGEIIVSDNGSTDGSKEIAQRCATRVVEQNIKGYGASLRKGINSANGKFVVIGDADGSHNFLDTHHFVEKLREGYDFVIGSRFKGEIKPGAMPFLHRYVGVPGLTLVLKLFYQINVSDSQCGMRGFTRESIPLMELKTNGMEFASELLIKAKRCGLKIVEIPIVVLASGRSRPSHLKPLRDGWRHLRLMFLSAPDALMFWPGVVLLAIGILKLVIFPKEVIGMVDAVIGFQMSSLGAFAYLIVMPNGARRKDRLWNLLLKYSRFENGLLIGMGMFLGGLLAIFYVSRSIIFLTIDLIGIQVVLSSFLFNMLGADSGSYLHGGQSNPDN